MQRLAHGGGSFSAGLGKGRRALVVAAVAGLWSFGLAGQASAQYTTPPPGGGTSTDTQTQPVVKSASQSTPVAQRAPAGRQGLPVTGGDVVGMAAVGAGAVVVGGTVLALRRRAEEPDVAQ